MMTVGGVPSEPRPQNLMAQTTPFVSHSSLDEPSAWLALKDRALDVAAEGITIADAKLPGRPLVYVNEGFVRGRPASAGRTART